MKINGKEFMNLQEAVAWLLQNNALPFQCSANYVADTEIAKTTIVNPSPAEVKTGAIVYFADGNIATVTGITSNGFTVGQDHIDLGLDVVGAIDGADITPASVVTDSITPHSISQTSLDSAYLGSVLFQTLKPRSSFPTPTAQIFENITDSNDRNRFVGGNGTSGYASIYCKWSLSGTHLMIVSAGSFNNGVEIPNNAVIAMFTPPAWVINKIVPVWASEYIQKIEVELVADDWTRQTMPVTLRKHNYDLYIETQGGSITLTANRAFRVQFELLIDND